MSKRWAFHWNLNFSIRCSHRSLNTTVKTNGDGNLFFTFIFPVTSKKQATCPTQLSGARKVLEPSRFLSPAHSRKKKKITSTGQLKQRVSITDFYWVTIVCKTCSSLHQDYLPSSHRAVKGEPNKKMRKLKHSEIKCHIASGVWIRNPWTPESTVFFHLN